MSALPCSTTALVIGGGPGGSTKAAFLTREGVDVTVVERAVFPRYHIGESLLPPLSPPSRTAWARRTTRPDATRGSDTGAGTSVYGAGLNGSDR